MTDGTNRENRRTARENLLRAAELLKGQPGLKLKEQRDRFEEAETLVAGALDALDEAQTVVADRRAAKKAAKASA